jgi:hypothetical protein
MDQDNTQKILLLDPVKDNQYLSRLSSELRPFQWWSALAHETLLKCASRDDCRPVLVGCSLSL